MATPPFLTQAAAAKAQAEVEGYQNGPEPALNPVNANTQQQLGNPLYVPGVASKVPYYPPSQETPNLQLSLQDMSADLAQNFVVLDNAIPIVGTADFPADYTGVQVGELYSFPSIISGIYNLYIVATAIPPFGVYQPAQLSINVSYTDSAGPEFNNGVVVISDTGQPVSVSDSVFLKVNTTVTINSSFVTFGIAGALPANAWVCPCTVAGSGAAYGATLTQANPNGGCTAFFYGVESLGGVPGNIIYTVLTGTDDFDTTGPVFIDAVSGTHYTSAGGKAAAYFTGPGFGVSMTQFVTGAFGMEMDVSPTTVLHLGPNVSGVPDQPSGRVIIPGPSPSLTHNYAWYDPVNGGVFVPTAPWTDAATRITFLYNEHIRVAQIG
jgi:hypothetical protein